GIVFPDVNTAEDAKAAVDACKFPPIGKRSVSGGYQVYDFRAVPLKDTVRALNDATPVVCMIETREGLSNVEKIAAVEGVDVVHVGSNALLNDMGARPVRRPRSRRRGRARDPRRQGPRQICRP